MVFDFYTFYAITLNNFWPIIGYVMISLAPLLFGRLLWFLWYYYKQAQYIKTINWVLLEIKMPREITKSPQAMEIVLAAFHQNVEGTWFTRLTEGVVRQWFALELVSIGGSVHFYIRVTDKHRNLIESQIYSQYPGVEIIVVDDYTKNVSFGLPGSDWDMVGFTFGLIKEDPYPIKTYIDYGLDKNPKEEEKTDPLTPVLELLGSLKPGEQMWLQFLVMATKERFKKKKSWFKKVDWVGQAEELVEEKLKKIKSSDQPSVDINRLSPGEKKVIEAIQRNVGKLGFDTGFRAIYLAKKDIFNKANFGALAGVIKQYNSADLNGFKPLTSTSIKYPWQDLSGWRLARMKYYMFDGYRRRSYFYPPYRGRPFVLSTEELATIYHLPGQVAGTPTLERIESKRSEPPANLPI